MGLARPLLFTKCSDISRPFRDRGWPLTRPSGTLSPMGEGLGGEGVRHYILQSSNRVAERPIAQVVAIKQLEPWELG
jgi:hypothetical protein